MKDYNKDSIQFLMDTKTTLKIEKAKEPKAPLWAKKGEKYGFNYVCTLENKKHKYTFDFWDSIRDREIIEAIQNIKMSFLEDNESIRAERLLKENGINTGIARNKSKKPELMKQYEPKEYDILACLNPLIETSLEDFCDSFGYDTDSITAEKIYKACVLQDNNLRRLFSDIELEKLSEIN